MQQSITPFTENATVPEEKVFRLMLYIEALGLGLLEPPTPITLYSIEEHNEVFGKVEDILAELSCPEEAVTLEITDDEEVQIRTSDEFDEARKKALN